MFACDLANVLPDLMCISKGITGGFLPMGVTLCSDRVESAFRSETGRTRSTTATPTPETRLLAPRQMRTCGFSMTNLFSTHFGDRQNPWRAIGSAARDAPSWGHAADRGGRSIGAARGRRRVPFSDASKALSVFLRARCLVATPGQRRLRLTSVRDRACAVALRL